MVTVPCWVTERTLLSDGFYPRGMWRFWDWLHWVRYLSDAPNTGHQFFDSYMGSIGSKKLRNINLFLEQSNNSTSAPQSIVGVEILRVFL